MVFPESRMQFAHSYQGKETRNGWLVLRLTGMDLEGVDRLYINLDRVEAMAQKRDQAREEVRGFWAMPDDKNE